MMSRGYCILRPSLNDRSRIIAHVDFDAAAPVHAAPTRALPPLEVVRARRDVADALAYAHARGVIHRDIKGENIAGAGVI